MSKINRRGFLKITGALSGSGLLPGSLLAAGKAGKAKVVVIGGGFGGATAAKYLRILDPDIEVTLIEPKKAYATCPGSNWVIAGLRNMDSITHSYENLSKKHGVNVIHDWVVSIDPEKNTVKLKGGDSVSYDRLIVSPGISFRNNIEGYDAAAMEVIPHAWQAGSQTELLAKQLHAMRDGGTVIVAAPPNPFRCPPGPPERVSMMANYIKRHKPKSKIIMLDAKDKFSKKKLFVQGWKKFYGYGTDKSLIEWVPKSKDGQVLSVDVKNMTVKTEFGEHKADVLNLIPAQKAGKIAETAGLTNDTGWCPVDHRTWESSIHKNIHVIGDAAIQKPLPKSGYAANSEAKACAANVVALLQGKEPIDPYWINTCYSLIDPEYGISVAMVYNVVDGKVAKMKGAGGLSPVDDESGRRTEAAYAQAWYTNIVQDIFG